mmetsp:Transcript_52093/g.149349  ORF Transcript_52093/g.149349 Transcript_52093/m.149349 type:complete len:418 (+) Transcript_52093:1046-2299(+)
MLAVLLRELVGTHVDEFLDDRDQLLGLQGAAPVVVQQVELLGALPAERLRVDVVHQILRQEGDYGRQRVHALREIVQDLNDLVMAQDNVGAWHVLVVCGVLQVGHDQDIVYKRQEVSFRDLPRMAAVPLRGQRRGARLAQPEGVGLAQADDGGQKRLEARGASTICVYCSVRFFTSLREGRRPQLGHQCSGQARHDIRHARRVPLEHIDQGGGPRRSGLDACFARPSLTLARVGEKVHHRQELRELHELVSLDDPIAIAIEHHRELFALLLGNGQRMGLTEQLNHRDELRRVQAAAGVGIQLGEARVAILLKLLVGEMIDQPLWEKRDKTPESLFVKFDHVQEVFELTLLDHRHVYQILALARLQVTGDDHELDEVAKFLQMDHAVVVRVEHRDEALALVGADRGDVGHAQALDHRH